jgi:hypothetical protein
MLTDKGREYLEYRKRQDTERRLLQDTPLAEPELVHYEHKPISMDEVNRSLDGMILRKR